MTNKANDNGAMDDLCDNSQQLISVDINSSFYTIVMLLTRMLIFISIPPPTHTFIPGLQPSFSASPAHHGLPFLLQD